MECFCSITNSISNNWNVSFLCSIIHSMQRGTILMKFVDAALSSTGCNVIIHSWDVGHYLLVTSRLRKPLCTHEIGRVVCLSQPIPSCTLNMADSCRPIWPPHYGPWDYTMYCILCSKFLLLKNTTGCLFDLTSQNHYIL